MLRDRGSTMGDVHAPDSAKNFRKCEKFTQMLQRVMLERRKDGARRYFVAGGSKSSIVTATHGGQRRPDGDLQTAVAVRKLRQILEGSRKRHGWRTGQISAAKPCPSGRAATTGERNSCFAQEMTKQRSWITCWDQGIAKGRATF